MDRSRKMKTRTKSAHERMAQQEFPHDEVLRAAQPDSMPARIRDALSDPRPASPPTREGWTRAFGRRRLLVTASMAAVVVAVGAYPVVSELSEPSRYAATPHLLSYTPLASSRSASEVLKDLAARARSQPPLPGSGRYGYIHTRSWNLSVGRTVDGELLFSRIETTDREEWIAPDGSGRILATQDGQRLISGTHGPWQAGSPGDVLDNPKHTTADWFQFTNDLWRLQAVSPQRHSKLLTNLAQQPGLILKGKTTDRAGRTGIAISTTTTDHEPKIRHVMILDPNTGMLLSMERVGLTASSLPIKPPATLSYTLWLDRGHTDSVYEKP